ncbi:LOW QUALITY PROTEIN: B3 domain-containing protein REM7 [Capsella rubella]|uniref:LOW QUALITY PROTEIN: B3 domain-containing protein REM7 n=1 Tax=Capsella rubella TaxID=81985 RepID=UPI000CD5014F|nr:LOW QUALITY PROTEIN: B3 domain-containing protein REM7 [Capsella rubella]
MADPVLQSPENPHFFKVLLPGFDSNLNIPMKFFSAYIEGRYEGKTVELESDASEKSWKVEMEGRRLTFGWKEFASSHDLRIGDVIIFRHQGALLFHVACFGPSCCEIQYRQSCNDDDHLYDDQENLKNESMKQSLKTEVESSLDEDKDNMVKSCIRKLPRKKHKRIPEADAKSFSSDEFRFVARLTDSNLQEDTLFFPKKFATSGALIKGSNNIVLMNEVAKKWRLILKFRESSRTFYMRDGWRSFAMRMGLNLEMPSRLN